MGVWNIPSTVYSTGREMDVKYKLWCKIAKIFAMQEAFVCGTESFDRVYRVPLLYCIGTFRCALCVGHS